jgi:hypothetical protein
LVVVKRLYSRLCCVSVGVFDILLGNVFCFDMLLLVVFAILSVLVGVALGVWYTSVCVYCLFWWGEGLYISCWLSCLLHVLF